uniref:Uncharacterized protein n=1 Tax=Chelonoidis abingdonii TaxID=106734 RepID=A0A8C0J558_CHEAB
MQEQVKSCMVPETGAALFNSPTSSSNSEANTEEGTSDGTNSEGQEASFRCCK